MFMGFLFNILRDLEKNASSQSLWLKLFRGLQLYSAFNNIYF